MIANTCERINTINASAVSWTLYSCTVININVTVPPTVASKTMTSVVSNKVLHEKNIAIDLVLWLHNKYGKKWSHLWLCIHHHQESYYDW